MKRKGESGLIERVIEHWLDKANERSFQVPFCHALASEGYTVLHLSRHCAMEMGKDILALSPNGTPCAFQLKSARHGKINLTQWRAEVEPQLMSLVMGKISHPSIKTSTPHKAYIVTNGEFEEEVIRAIYDFNKGLADNGVQQKLETIVKGELFEKFKNLRQNFWPNENVDLKNLLELYANSGREMLSKEKLFALLSRCLPFQTNDEKAPNINECSRAIASAAILCSLAVSSFVESDNHLAEFEAWTIYIACVYALAEKWNLPRDIWGFEVDVATKSIYNILGRLCDELMKRDTYVEGNPFTDFVIQQVRKTHLVGLLSIYALWLNRDYEEQSKEQDFIKAFCLKHKGDLWLWGEYAIPQFLSLYFYLRTIDATPDPDFLLFKLINTITFLNKPRGKGFLATAYYDAEEILPHILATTDKKLEDSFRGKAQSLESLVHLYVRTNWKQTMKSVWPDVTKIAVENFIPENKWQWYLWRCDKGTVEVRLVKPTQNWDDLKKHAFESEGKELPNLIKSDPIYYLCFLMVFPHRVDSSGVRWVSTNLKDI